MELELTSFPQVCGRALPGATIASRRKCSQVGRGEGEGGRRRARAGRAEPCHSSLGEYSTEVLPQALRRETPSSVQRSLKAAGL